MLFELVKNSLRAVQERYMNSDEDVPPVRIIVADGEEDVTIKVVVFVITYHELLVTF
jgi:pyruvate dehydrogenase kinase 2/3/4